MQIFLYNALIIYKKLDVIARAGNAKLLVYYPRHLFMKKSIVSQALAFCLAGFLQFGTVSAADTENTEETTAESGSGLSERESDSIKELRFDSSWLGLTGPLEISTSYNDDYGVVVGASFATYINERNAVAFEVEVGQNKYRLNGTYGFAINDRNRIKVSLERLAEQDDYDFASGTETEWVGQNAAGATYQYIFADGWLETAEFNAYGAQAESVDYDDVLFYDASGAPKINKRRITGGLSYGLSAGVTTNPWETARWGFALHYDAVSYDMQYDEDDPSTSGFGFSTNLEQILTERLKGEIGMDVLSTDHTYNAGLTWLAPTEAGSRLEVSLVGAYLNSQTTGDSNMEMGMQAAYGWDEGPAGDVAHFTGFEEISVADLKTWTRDPAVRMPEVMAVVDEAVVDAYPVLNRSLDDLYFAEKTAVNHDVSNYFSSPDGSALTFTAVGLPQGLSMNSQGAIVGTTPDIENNAEYAVTVNAQNTWGYNISDNLTLTVGAIYLPPRIREGAQADFQEEEGTPIVINAAEFFEDPNNPSQAMLDNGAEPARKMKAGATPSSMTYELVEVPAGWDTKLNIDPVTGFLGGVTPVISQQNKTTDSFRIGVRAALNYVENAVSEPYYFTVTVNDEYDNIFVNPMAPISFTEFQLVEGYDISTAFSIQDGQPGTLNYRVVKGQDKLTAAGLALTEQGLIKTTTQEGVIYTTDVANFEITVEASLESENGSVTMRNVAPISINIVSLAGEIATSDIPDQNWVEQSTLTDQPDEDASTGNLNFNEYFKHEAEGRETGEKLSFTLEPADALGTDIRVDENGFLVGKIKDITENLIDEVVTVKASYQQGKVEISQPLTYTLWVQPTMKSAALELNERLQIGGNGAEAIQLDVNAADFMDVKPADTALIYDLESPAGVSPQWTIDENGKIAGVVPNYDPLKSNNSYTFVLTAKNAANPDVSQSASFILKVLDVTNNLNDVEIAEKSVAEGYSFNADPIDLQEAFGYPEPLEFYTQDKKLSDIGLQIVNGKIVGTAEPLVIDGNTYNVGLSQDYEITIYAKDADDCRYDAGNPDACEIKPAKATWKVKVYAEVSSDDEVVIDVFEENRGKDTLYTFDVNDFYTGNFQPVDDNGLSYALENNTIGAIATQATGEVSFNVPKYQSGGELGLKNTYRFQVTGKNSGGEALVPNDKKASMQSTTNFVVHVKPYYLTVAKANVSYNLPAFSNNIDVDLTSNVEFGEPSLLRYESTDPRLAERNLQITADGHLTSLNANAEPQGAAILENVPVKVIYEDSVRVDGQSVEQQINETEFTVTINLEDGELLAVTETAPAVKLSEGDDAQTIDMAAQFSYTPPSALDDTTPPIEYTVSTADAQKLAHVGLSLNGETGEITGVPAINAQPAEKANVNYIGTNAITVVATVGEASASVKLPLEVFAAVTSSDSEVRVSFYEGDVMNAAGRVFDVNDADKGAFVPVGDGNLLYTPEGTVPAGLTINNNGVFTGTVPAYNATGGNEYQFTLTGTNVGNSNLKSDTVYIYTVLPKTISVVPSAVTYNFVSNQRVDEDLNQYVTYYGDKANLSFTISPEDEAKLAAANLELTPAGVLKTKDNLETVYDASTKGSSNVTVTVDNVDGGSAALALTVKVKNSDGITFTTPGTQQYVEHEEVSRTNGLDLNSAFTSSTGALKFAAADKANADKLAALGLSIDENGVIVGTVSPVDRNTLTDISIRAYVEEEPSIDVVQPISFQTVAIPVITPKEAQPVFETEDYQLDLAAQYAPAGELKFSIEPLEGESLLPGMKIDKEGNVTGTAPLYNQNGENTYGFKVVATNVLDETVSAEQEFSYEVDPVLSVADQSIRVAEGEKLDDLMADFVNYKGKEKEKLKFTMTESHPGALLDVNASMENNGEVNATIYSEKIIMSASAGMGTTAYVMPVKVKVSSDDGLSKEFTIEYLMVGKGSIGNTSTSVVETNYDGKQDGRVQVAPSTSKLYVYIPGDHQLTIDLNKFYKYVEPNPYEITGNFTTDDYTNGYTMRIAQHSQRDNIGGTAEGIAWVQENNNEDTGFKSKRIEQGLENVNITYGNNSITIDSNVEGGTSDASGIINLTLGAGPDDLVQRKIEIEIYVDD